MNLVPFYPSLTGCNPPISAIRSFLRASALRKVND
jgi:hypothetical protein